MARATCTTCHETMTWRATRGNRLADHRCRCGGALVGLTTGQPSRTRGTHYGTCAACGRRRIERTLVTLPRAMTIWPDRAVVAGQRICRWHEILRDQAFIAVGRVVDEEAITC